MLNYNYKLHYNHRNNMEQFLFNYFFRLSWLLPFFLCHYYVVFYQILPSLWFPYSFPCNRIFLVVIHRKTLQFFYIPTSHVRYCLPLQYSIPMFLVNNLCFLILFFCIYPPVQVFCNILRTVSIESLLLRLY